MAGEKHVWRTTVFSWGGYRISRGVNAVELPVSREEVDAAMFEDVGDATEKGVYTNTIGLSGAFSDVENALVEDLAAEEGGAPAIFFRDSTAKPLAPGGAPAAVAAIGSPALFMNARMYGLDVENSRGALHNFKARMRATSGRLQIGEVLYTNVGTSALTTGAAVVTTPLNVGELVAGKILAVAVAAVDPPGVPGTTPTAAVRLMHDINGSFATPVSAHTFDTFTEPGAQIVFLDGDTLSLPGETHWALEVTVAGTGAQFTFMAGIDLFTK